LIQVHIVEIHTLNELQFGVLVLDAEMLHTLELVFCQVFEEIDVGVAAVAGFGEFWSVIWLLDFDWGDFDSRG